MIQTNISLYDEQWKLIKQECGNLGQSLSFFIRELVDGYFSGSGYVIDQKKKNFKTATEKIIEKKPKIVNSVTEVKKVINTENLCKHGMMPGLCKYGC